MMTQYKITYRRTGSGEKDILDYVYIHSGDKMKDGNVHNITDAIQFFEELAEAWGTYENKNAIRNIEVSEI